MTAQLTLLPPAVSTPDAGSVPPWKRYTDLGAAFDVDGVYRYRLWRTWDASKPRIAWVGLNPSVGDGKSDDPTIKRIASFSDAWGFGELTIANLFAVVTPHPDELGRVSDPVGPENDRHIGEVAASADRIVVAWGSNARAAQRAKLVTERLRTLGPLYCLRLTKSGAPEHPLYIPKYTTPVSYAEGV